MRRLALFVLYFFFWGGGQNIEKYSKNHLKNFLDMNFKIPKGTSEKKILSPIIP